MLATQASDNSSFNSLIIVPLTITKGKPWSPFPITVESGPSAFENDVGRKSRSAFPTKVELFLKGKDALVPTSLVPANTYGGDMYMSSSTEGYDIKGEST